MWRHAWEATVQLCDHSPFSLLPMPLIGFKQKQSTPLLVQITHVCHEKSLHGPHVFRLTSPVDMSGNQA